MRWFHDVNLGGHVGIFDGPLELAEAARDANKGPNPFKRLERIQWPGIHINPGDWDGAAALLRKPWPEAVSMVRYVADQVRQSRELPLPKSVKRRPRWSDDDGDIDVDRAMKGESDMYRSARRHRSTAPMHIAFVTNLDATIGWWHTNSTGVFFRSAASIAMSDILEDAGYSVEIWIWSRGLNVFPEPDSEQFIACKVKAAGDVVDYDALCSSMSDWFCTQAIVGSIASNPHAKVKDKGLGVEASLGNFYLENGEPDWYSYGIDYWVSYLDIETDCQVIPIPMVCGSKDSAVECAKNVIDRIISKE